MSTRTPTSRAAQPRRYFCANCPGEITVADNRNGGLITVNIDGHAKPAHRHCPPTTDTDRTPNP